MGRMHILICSILFIGFSVTVNALSENYYAKTCPGVEKLVRQAVLQKINQTFVTIPATLRLYFHDCAVSGCDASIMIQSRGNNKAEKDHPDNLSLAGDGFDTVIKAKAAVDAVPGCRNKVSCADILTIATRDVVNLAGGPFYKVELGRFDSLTSTAASVNGKLPQPSDGLNRLNSLFGSLGLTQTDMVALSGAHTLGFSHCDKFANRIYGFSANSAIDPTLNKQYATQLQAMCPRGVDPRIAVNMDTVSPRRFDNWYYADLKQGKGLFTSDQVLYSDPRSRPTVENWATNNGNFYSAFSSAMIKLGRVGVKNANNGNIRAGGPFYKVELGRFDSLTSTAASVNGKLPQPSDGLNRLNSLFGSLSLPQTDMVALSGAHTLGFSHCDKFANRIYGFSEFQPTTQLIRP